ncbi:NADH dehydrogenase subunit C [Thermosyntropha lipolytica DSM 11003]|uniref:NAD(P)H dehydrogenase subunit J n=1 Tax=Thermosyntropha lipolytica DSM 11003 TaxID=1123382 RepID=A0A1M5P3I8_9FIRM|nr:NADH-quinone oxidoreductase subunit C [Thermosyntropha lipolytica]SHG96332.1 NADH dehydrogenase subunit C [Thermosyntropha lipolytica DSM 11003]
MGDLLKEIRKNFPSVTIEEDEFLTLRINDGGSLLPLLKLLKTGYGFNYLANLTAVDYKDKFTVVYHIYKIPENEKVCIKVDINRDKPELDSAVSLWPAADFQEREVYDLMGIVFRGHPNLERILLPADFVGHPLRKDYKPA